MTIVYKPARFIRYSDLQSEECFALEALQEADLEFAKQLKFDSFLSSTFQATMKRELTLKMADQEPALKSSVYTVMRAFRNRARFVLLQAERIEDVILHMDYDEKVRVQEELSEEIFYTLSIAAQSQLKLKNTVYDKLIAMIKSVEYLSKKKPVPSPHSEIPIPVWDSSAIKSFSIHL